jgi:SNF family Na+-dependent transporter
MGAIALGWIPIIVVMSISFFYKNIMNQKIWYLFVYFSGVIASKQTATQYVEQDHLQASIESHLPKRSLV